MRGRASFKAVILIATISSAIQGIAWCVLSLLAIFCYTCILKPGPYKHGNQIRITYLHYLAAYFQGNCDESLDFYKQMNEITSPEKVLVIDIFVYIFNFALAISSIIAMFALRSKRRHIMLGWLLFYVIISFCVAILDLIATGVVASDYFAVTNAASFKNSGLAGLSLIVLVIITSRGVFLWAANLIFSLYLIAFVCRSHKYEDSAYTDTSTSRNSFQKEVYPQTPTPKQEEGFNIDSKAMENRPIVFIQSGGDDRKLPNEYPSYTAYSRWPRLHPDNRLPTTLPLPSNHHSQQQQQQQQERQQQLQQKLQQQLKQQLDQTRSSQINPAPPAPDRPLYNQRFAQQQQQLVGRGYDGRGGASSSDTGRPGSLQEAILTVRPLRQVRPRITAIPDGYP